MLNALPIVVVLLLGAPLEADIVAEVNVMRADPAAYAASVLDERLRSYEGDEYQRTDGAVVTTREGTAAVREAIRALRSSPALPTLDRLSGLDAAAGEHVNDQKQGRIGHIGSDGSEPDQRVSRHGEWAVMTAENIYYGAASARDVVIGLLVDDGVADRSHRQVLLDPSYKVVGIACGPHATYETVCVMEYAVGFTLH